jgi:hypothetical protein
MSGSTSCGHGPSCESDKFIAAETEKWAKVVKFAGIKAQSRVIEHFLTDNGRDALAQPGVYPRVAEFPDADASKRAAAFAASKVSAVPPTIKFVSLLSVSDLRRTSHVGTPSCVKTSNMHSPTSANSAGLGHSGGSGFHSISGMSCRFSSGEPGAILRR